MKSLFTFVLLALFSVSASAALFGAGAVSVSGSDAATQGGTASFKNGASITRSGVGSVSGGAAGVFLTGGGLVARETTYSGTGGFSATGSTGNAVGGSVYYGDAAARSGAGWGLQLP